MSKELDIACARALGWTDLADNAYTPAGQMLCGTPPPGVVPMWSTGRSVVPRYSTDIAACVTLEAEIARRGLQPQYIDALLFAIDGDASSTGLTQRYWRDKLHPEHFWLLVTATADQRARAFVAAVSGERRENRGEG